MILITEEEFNKIETDNKETVEYCSKCLIKDFSGKDIDYAKEALNLSKSSLEWVLKPDKLTKEFIENGVVLHKVILGDLVYYTSSTIQDHVEVLLKKYETLKRRFDGLDKTKIK